MYCNNCGKKIEKNTKFCQFCGTKQKHEKMDNKSSSGEKDEKTPVAFKNEKKKNSQQISEEETISKWNNFNIWASLFGLIYYFYKGLWKKGLLLTSILLLVISFISFFVATNSFWLLAIILHIILFGYMANIDIKRKEENKEGMWKEAPDIFSKKIVPGIVIVSTVIFIFSLFNAYEIDTQDSPLSISEQFVQHSEMKDYNWEKNERGNFERTNVFAKDSITTENYLEKFKGTWLDENEDTGLGVEITDTNIYFLVNYDINLEKIDVTNYFLSLDESKIANEDNLIQIPTLSLETATEFVKENIDPDITKVSLALDTVEGERLSLAISDDNDDLSSKKFLMTDLTKTNEKIDEGESPLGEEDYEDYSDYDNQEEYNYNKEEKYDYGQNVGDTYPSQEELREFVTDYTESLDYSLDVEDGAVVIFPSDRDVPSDEADKIKNNIEFTKNVSDDVGEELGKDVPVSLEEPFQYEYSVTFIDGQPRDASADYGEVLTELGFEWY